MVSNSLRLSHPAKFETRKLSLKDSKDDARRVSHELDNRVLEAQSKLSQAVKEGQVSVGEFCDSVSDLEQFARLQAEFRADGFSKEELLELTRTFKECGQDTPLKIDPTLKALYQQTQGGNLNPHELTEELNWRTQRSYGEVVAHRTGPVFQEERAKLRAHLYVPRQSKANPSPEPVFHPGLPALAQKGLEIFERLDRNGDQNVDRAEARQILTRYSEFGLSPAQAATLYSCQEEFAALVDPKHSHENLRREDLEFLTAPLPAKVDRTVSEHVSKISKRYDAQLRLQSLSQAEFKKGDLFTPSNVKQGLEGSCWLLCNLPALTDEELGQVIKPEKDGYRVTLADGRDTFVTPLNEVEKRVYSRGDGEWSGLLEKGVSQILEESNKDINGGFARVGRKMLAGHDSERFSLTDPPARGEPDLRDRETLFRTLEQAFRNGSAVFAAAERADHDKEISEISSAAHAYTVLDVNSETDTVVVRNPWGHGERADLDGRNNGIFELTQDQFIANFSYLYLDKGAV